MRVLRSLSRIDNRPSQSNVLLCMTLTVGSAALAPNGHETLFATTFVRFQQSRAAQRIHVLDMPYVPPAKHSNWDELKRVLWILRAARREKILLLNSSSGRYQPDTMALALLGFLPKRFRPKVAFLGDMWQPNSGLRHRLDRMIVKLADRSVDRYFVHSSEEVKNFPAFWGLDKSKVRLCLYFWSARESDLTAPPPPQEDFVFAGGNSHRDYEPLLEAARQMPDQKFVFATFRLGGLDLPPNVIAKQVPHEEFIRLMRASRAVVTPIKQGLHRSAGQQTYLNAMLFCKPSIVNETNGARDHIQSGVDGIIVDGSPQSYIDALRWVLDPKNAAEVDQMQQLAHRHTSERFSLQKHLDHVVNLMMELNETPSPLQLSPELSQPLQTK